MNESKEEALNLHPKSDMTWAQYAARYNQMWVERKGGQWLIYLLSGTEFCETIKEAREIAAQYGCSIIL